MPLIVPGLAFGQVLSSPARLALAADVRVGLVAEYDARFCEKASGVAAGAGDTVSRWLDQSGNGNHATQPSAGLRHTLVDVNGKPLLRSTGGTDIFAPPSVLDASTATNEYTLFIVAKQDTGAAGYQAIVDSPSRIVLLMGPLQYNSYFGAFSPFAFGPNDARFIDNDLSLVCVRANRATGQVTVRTTADGGKEVNGSIPTSTGSLAEALHFGGVVSGGDIFNGHYGAVRYYNRALPDAELDAVFARLKSFWEIV